MSNLLSLCMLVIFSITWLNAKDFPIEIILCRHCGFELTNSSAVINVATDKADRTINHTKLGNTSINVQKFLNPNGQPFNVFTVKDANVKQVTEPIDQFSWFPGYSWTVVSCPKCGIHLGWLFKNISPKLRQNTITQFVGLIYDQVVSENFAYSTYFGPPSFAA
ncbi:Protein cereblon-like protein [Trichoplax sp. H2]|nr:Protein cereblon-like protein [Trichoplax sp. H2]|eukprot:RDD42130.1 Protein cereblon-like protein [Trichoplax sp. H2]